MVIREPESKKKKRLYRPYRHVEGAIILQPQHHHDEPLAALGLQLTRTLDRCPLARPGGHKTSAPILPTLSSITP